MNISYLKMRGLNDKTDLILKKPVNMFPLLEIDLKHSDLFFFDQNIAKIQRHPEKILVSGAIDLQTDDEFT